MRAAAGKSLENEEKKNLKKKQKLKNKKNQACF